MIFAHSLRDFNTKPVVTAIRTYRCGPGGLLGRSRIDLPCGVSNPCAPAQPGSELVRLELFQRIVSVAPANAVLPEIEHDGSPLDEDEHQGRDRKSKTTGDTRAAMIGGPRSHRPKTGDHRAIHVPSHSGSDEDCNKWKHIEQQHANASEDRVGDAVVNARESVFLQPDNQLANRRVPRHVH